MCSKLTLPVNLAFLAIFCQKYISFSTKHNLKINKQGIKLLNKSSNDMLSHIPEDIPKFIEESMSKMDKMLSIKCPV